MKLTKLILFTFPVLLASLLLISPATAEVTQPAQYQRVELVSSHPNEATVTPKFSQKSNPINDAMGCSCAVCVNAKLQLQGKLSLSSML
ncbi:hypothetical protein DSM106972_062070 [Dulcicalothrix desertica PCC 7102]|uniref:Uncharacterized protein n=1 Tax=Dulcicalothrix desertica PCC 7102 TaxID=232991 RepID=A0A433V7N9_9CYAN|nr:hypothetical protein [Dulcicalothrix desertica]RUT02132.1 hypothetical protein DSM106972_062070 [Dulcicalothrix desertica PCC 7102]TWH53776.1 hypothetical protein CAL7102_01757 [Dulcicalothrix desertica PCC 7102]